MRELECKLTRHIDLLMERYPSLETVKEDIIAAYDSGTASSNLSLPLFDAGRTVLWKLK